MGASDTGIVLLGRSLQELGYTVSEHPSFGGGHMSGHDPDGYHPKGQAIDVNKDDGDEAKALDALNAMLEENRDAFGIVELLWRTADHYDHLHVAIVGPPTRALSEWVRNRTEIKSTSVLGAATDKVTGIAGDIAGAGAGVAADIAKALVGLIFDAIGADGARILLYVVLVLGGAGLAYLGMARIVGLRGDTPAPAGAPA
jgi:hypothetical protein